MKKDNVRLCKKSHRKSAEATKSGAAHTVTEATCMAAPFMNSSVALYNSACERSFSVSCCPGYLKRPSCQTGGKYCCFNYQELILRGVRNYLFKTPKMCCKGLHYVSDVLMSTALLSFSYRVSYWLLLHNSYWLDSVPNQL